MNISVLYEYGVNVNILCHRGDSVVESQMDRSWFRNICNVVLVEPNQGLDIHLH